MNLDGKRLVSNHPYFDGSRDTMLRGLPPANKLFGNKVLMGKIHIVLGGAGCTSVCRGLEQQHLFSEYLMTLGAALEVLRVVQF